MIGSIIGGRYKITGKLGEGGIGDVYKAVHAELGSYYAVKKFRSELTRKAFFQRAFLKSARSHSCLDHEGIVRVTDFFQENGSCYLVMEYVEGEDLSMRLIRQGRFSEEKALFCTQRILSALIHAHRKGIVHLDIKPSNILVDKNGCVRITDFDIAFDLNGGSNRMFARAGTPPYASPEQMDSKGRVDQRADVYAVGCVLYEMLSGALPSNRSPGRPADLVALVGERLNAIVMKAIAADPDDRFDGAGDFMECIEEYRKSAYVRCDHCGRRHKLGEGRTARKARCPACGRTPGPGFQWKRFAMALASCLVLGVSTHAYVNGLLPVTPPKPAGPVQPSPIPPLDREIHTKMALLHIDNAFNESIRIEELYNQIIDNERLIEDMNSRSRIDKKFKNEINEKYRKKIDKINEEIKFENYIDQISSLSKFSEKTLQEAINRYEDEIEDDQSKKGIWGIVKRHLYQYVKTGMMHSEDWKQDFKSA